MTKRLIMFDLGCGLGGASAAMVDRGWIVVRVDREHDVKADRYCDLRSLIALPRWIDLLWCSTSCQQFSVRNLPYGNLAKAKSKPIDLSVEQHVKELIDQSSPRYWVVENVMAARKWLTPIFGPVRSVTGGHVLWSNIPLLMPFVRGHKNQHWTTFRYRKRHLILSTIPYEMSLALAKTVERLASS